MKKATARMADKRSNAKKIEEEKPVQPAAREVVRGTPVVGGAHLVPTKFDLRDPYRNDISATK